MEAFTGIRSRPGRREDGLRSEPRALYMLSCTRLYLTGVLFESGVTAAMVPVGMESDSEWLGMKGGAEGRSSR